jgi:hypothetical protein
MNIESERAAFEAWYLDHFYMGDKQCGLEWLSTEPCGGYRHSIVRDCWDAWQARAALSAPNHGEQVRQMVPDGWKLVPVEATTEMVSALKARISCTSRGGILNAGNALNDAIAAAPSAGSQEQGE